MHESCSDRFEKDPEYEIIRKISSSMWRWGWTDKSVKGWNSLVRAYNAIKSFDLGLKGLTIKLDYSTYYLEKGYSKYTRTFLDGVFAFLIYYKDKHVMTIGFSVASDNRILLSQFQLKNRKGNRFLYKLPKNRLDFIVDKFYKHFKGFDIYLVDGKSLAKSTQNMYENALEKTKYWLDNSDHLKDEHQKEYDEIKKKLKEFSSFIYKHMVKVYSISLINYKRVQGKGVRVGCLRFHKVIKR